MYSTDTCHESYLFRSVYMVTHVAWHVSSNMCGHLNPPLSIMTYIIQTYFYGLNIFYCSKIKYKQMGRATSSNNISYSPSRNLFSSPIPIFMIKWKYELPFSKLCWYRIFTHHIWKNSLDNCVRKLFCFSMWICTRAREIVSFAGSGPIFETGNRFISRQEAKKSVHKILYFPRFCNIQTDIVTCQNCSHLIISCYLS